MRYGMATICLLAAGLPAFGTVYTPSAGFSLNSNPNGHWSFGYRTTGVMSTNLNLFTNPIASDLSVWDRGLPYPLNYPRVVKNTSAAPVFWGTDIPLQPGELGMAPGGDFHFCIVRFVVPHDGLWDMSYRMTTLDRSQDGITAWAVKNGSVWFSNILPAGQSGAEVGGAATSQVLVAGDIIEFVTGSNGSIIGDTVRLDATIVAVPAPSSIGLLMLAACARRRPSRR